MLRLDTVHGNRLPLLICLLLALVAFTGCRRSPEAKKAKFMESGQAFMQAKDYPRAILQFRNAAQMVGKDKDPEPYYRLALAFLADGQFENGVNALRQALRLNKNHIGANLKMAELASRSSNKEQRAEAEKTAEKIAAANPNNFDALSTLGLTELNLGKQEDAEKHLEAALQKFPTNLKAAVGIARIKLQNKDLKGAEQVLQTAVQQAPKSADPLVALGSFYFGAKRWPDAEGTLQKALQIDPKSDSALLLLAAVQIQSGQKDKAEQTYAKIAALPPAKYKPMHAQFLFQEGKRDAAIAEFAKLAKDSPDDRDARTNLVKAYWASNRRAEAEKVLTDALKHNPKDALALTQRGQMELVGARYTEAQTDADMVLRNHPESFEAHFIKANTYRVRGEGALERQELGEALRYKKDLLSARLQLAQSLLQQRDGKAALAVLDSKDMPNQQKRTLPVLVLRNYALIETGDLDTAQKNVNSVLAQVKTPDLLLQDAMIKGLKKDYAGARVPLELLLKASPEDVRALDLLAKTYSNQKQLTLGTQKIREHAASQPKSARVQKFLGDWLTATGDHEGALQAYTAAKQLDPKLTGTDMAMARLYLADNKNDAARQILNPILKTAKDNNNAEAFLWMGVIEERALNYEAAMNNYHQVLSLNANNVMALNNLAFLLAEHGQPQQIDEALKLAQQVRAISPQSSNIEDTMGWVYYKKGIYSSAIQQLEDAKSRDEAARMPSPLHRYHLAMAYLKHGDHKRGNEELNAALKLNPNLPEAKQAMTLLAQTKAASN